MTLKNFAAVAATLADPALCPDELRGFRLEMMDGHLAVLIPPDEPSVAPAPKPKRRKKR